MSINRLLTTDFMINFQFYLVVSILILWTPYGNLNFFPFCFTQLAREKQNKEQNLCAFVYGDQARHQGMEISRLEASNYSDIRRLSPVAGLVGIIIYRGKS